MTNWLYFKPEEIEGLDNELVARLDQARHLAKIPFTITDGLRTPASNIDPNSVENSAHLRGLAADLRCHDSRSLFRIFPALISVGFRRVGLYYRLDSYKLIPTHIHVDLDTTKPQDVIWSTLEL